MGSFQRQYCPPHYNTAEWRMQLHHLLEEASKEQSKLFPFGDLNWSKWASKLKSFLEKYWSNLNEPYLDWDSAKRRIKAPSGLASKLVGDIIQGDTNLDSSKIRMSTFHDIKGETLDATLIVSSSDNSGKKSGRYFMDWLDEDGEKEHIRFAYVASSRPKHLLIWAIPRIDNNPLMNNLQEMGFESE